jgi:hypothetical protein
LYQLRENTNRKQQLLTIYHESYLEASLSAFYPALHHLRTAQMTFHRAFPYQSSGAVHLLIRNNVSPDKALPPSERSMSMPQLILDDANILLAQLPIQLQMNSQQPNYITKTMNELSDSNANKRQKTETEHGGHYGHDDKESLSSYRDGTSAGDDDSIISFSSSDSSLFDIFDELEAHPNAIQLVASSGGLITHCKSHCLLLLLVSFLTGSCKRCLIPHTQFYSLFPIRAGNEAFSDITHKSSSSLVTNPITIFDLVDSKSIPSLYGMLALALHNVPIVEEEIFSPTVNKNRSYASLEEEEEEVAESMTTTEMAGDDDLEKKSRPSSSSHLSITLPCKSFHKATTQYNVTVRKYRDLFLFFCYLTYVINLTTSTSFSKKILYVDAASMKRCFLGILTPRRTAPQREDCSNGDIDHESCLSNGGSFGAFASTNAPSNHLTRHVHYTKEQREDGTKQRIKSLTEEHGAAGSTAQLPNIPCGKVLRIDDDFLCQILFDSK